VTSLCDAAREDPFSAVCVMAGEVGRPAKSLSNRLGGAETGLIPEWRPTQAGKYRYGAGYQGSPQVCPDFDARNYAVWCPCADAPLEVKFGSDFCALLRFSGVKTGAVIVDVVSQLWVANDFDTLVFNCGSALWFPYPGQL